MEIPIRRSKFTLHSELCHLIKTFLYHRCRLIKLKKKNISRRAFLGLLQMLKPRSFRGHCPLDPRRGSAPGPRQGPLSGPLDPTLLNTTLSWIVNFYPWLAAPILNSFRRAWSEIGHSETFELCGGGLRNTCMIVPFPRCEICPSLIFLFFFLKKTVLFRCWLILSFDCSLHCTLYTLYLGVKLWNKETLTLKWSRGVPMDPIKVQKHRISWNCHFLIVTSFGICLKKITPHVTRQLR